jgi:hypothetical protein
MKEFVRMAGPVIPSVNVIQVEHAGEKGSLRGSVAGKASNPYLQCPCPTPGFGNWS